MTGFGVKEADIAPFGKISVELRSSNHKFLDIAFHLPPGFLSLEDKIKKEIEAKIKRGRLTCVIQIAGSRSSAVFINKPLLQNYLRTLNQVKEQFHIKDDLSINTLIHLPGILSLGENRIDKDAIWPRLKNLINQAVSNLARERSKEGKALAKYLKDRSDLLRKDLTAIKTRYKKAADEKIKSMKSDEERSSFLKNTDITEEVDRLAFHIRNFKAKISATSGAVGKELDFIAQEMQREANTGAAKSFDVAVSATIVQMKSHIEKIREQVQNIE